MRQTAILTAGRTVVALNFIVAIFIVAALGPAWAGKKRKPADTPTSNISLNYTKPVYTSASAGRVGKKKHGLMDAGTKGVHFNEASVRHGPPPKQSPLNSGSLLQEGSILGPTNSVAPTGSPLGGARGGGAAPAGPSLR